MSITAEKIITIEEGFSQRMYRCTMGWNTIGYGRVVGKKGDPLTNEVATKEKEILFVREKIREISYQLMSRFPVAWNNCNQAQQAILISIAYQLGVAGLSAFQKMWAALNRKDFDMAAREMLNSKWNSQTPNRAKRHAEVMRTGNLIRYYRTNGEIP